MSLSFTNSPFHLASETSRGNAAALGALKTRTPPQGIQHVVIGRVPPAQAGLCFCALAQPQFCLRLVTLGGGWGAQPRGGPWGRPFYIG